ncbi:cyclin-dependent protein kinase complex component [Pochonia chlamydosporia 170]|uniref:Cyclin-dependent protein kinase complex component n=1 Tax=Pochonia chlamydosporia 170 TaxID=1380566 RepID=A0A179FQJ3_METCM|nr:cyclin-dependent protein kinase complex component [Pochonia chlamydosporia 170]OAQ67886.1 cyclin-dependent protein kinase complex component [Pochonia chlamydosporia 170]
MAALIGDLVPDISRFHDMIVNPSSRQNHRQHQSPPQRQRSHSRSQAQDSPPRRSSSRPRAAASTPRSQRRDEIESSATDRRNSSGAATRSPTQQRARKSAATDGTSSADGASSKFPSPPPSSSPPVASGTSPVDDAKEASMASQTGDVVSAAHQPLRNAPGSMNAAGRHQQPSPPSSQSFHIPDSSLASSSFSHAGPSSTQQTSQDSQQTVIHVRDLAHMQSLADAQMLGGSSSTSLDPNAQIKYEISGMPIADIIEMVAALLTKITTTNDLQHDAMQRNVAHQQQANQSSDSGSHMSPLSHSVLAFHGKNVPAITILSYLSRIHKYCPTTYEVFLSLLVYFDRMTERVNEIVMKSEQSRSRAASQSHPHPSGTSRGDTTMHDNAHESDESDSDLADDDDDDDAMVDSPTASGGRNESGKAATVPEDRVPVSPATYFVVDSFNIHRLIISGVTCASKFFSDVFYTNSRYAKVGGLPLAELNHLEIQFLVLNDFRLAVPVEDLEAYATMLVEFYAREVMTQKSATGA